MTFPFFWPPFDKQLFTVCLIQDFVGIFNNHPTRNVIDRSTIYTVYIMYAPKVHISGEDLRCCEPSLAHQEM